MSRPSQDPARCHGLGGCQGQRHVLALARLGKPPPRHIDFPIVVTNNPLDLDSATDYLYIADCASSSLFHVRHYGKITAPIRTFFARRQMGSCIRAPPISARPPDHFPSSVGP